jgi:hypothetical protein
MRTGEFVSFTSSTGSLFPLKMGKSFHDAEFIKRGKLQSAKLVHRTEQNGKACDDLAGGLASTVASTISLPTP